MTTRAYRAAVALCVVAVVAGLIGCLWPLVSNFAARSEQARTVSRVTSEAAALPVADHDRLLAQARAWNAWLGGYADSSASTTALPYDDQLRQGEDGAMGWLWIPRAGIKLPIYHGDGASALAQGVGHCPTTSLPVGGEKAHCWLEGHSGMAASSLLDGIRVLEAGDVLALNVLGDVYAYRVTGWEIVTPEEAAAQVAAKPAQGDHVTLVTCTTTPDQWNPKGRTGINDRRLLVHAERCAYDAAEFGKAESAAATDPAVVVGEHSLQAVIAVVLLALVLLVVIVRAVLRRRRRARGAHVR